MLPVILLLQNMKLLSLTLFLWISLTMYVNLDLVLWSRKLLLSFNIWSASIHTVMLESFNVCELQVEAEVSRLEQLKSSKMKELILKKRTELEEICSRIHVVSEAYIPIEHSIEAIESGKIHIQVVLWKRAASRKCYVILSNKKAFIINGFWIFLETIV